ncbi:MAG: hypothetical protein MZV49_25810 [Rhodopseudomonas palustris]|nr:hypothetical protein [Rhodopseudomonas palustris]
MIDAADRASTRSCARQTPAPAYAAQVKQALATLKTFRDDELARPIAGLGYRQYPRLREDVQSLAGYLGRGVRAPNEGELTRMKDLTAQVDQAVGDGERRSSRRTSRRSTTP